MFYPKMKATQLVEGDEFEDGTYVVAAYDDGADGVWLTTDGVYSTEGYVNANTTFAVERTYPGE